MEANQLNKLLDLLKLTGGKYILVEHGQPQAVLMSYEEFEDIVVSRSIRALSDRLENMDAGIEGVNKAITQVQLEEDLRQEVVVPDLEVQELRVEPIDPANPSFRD